MMEFLERTRSGSLSASAPPSPTEAKFPLILELQPRKGRRVNFPTDDQIVTGFMEAPDPWTQGDSVTTEGLISAYVSACEKQGIRPQPKIISQLEEISNFTTRKCELNLKGLRICSRQVEALEEILKRVQFSKIYLGCTFVDEEGPSSLFDMIEYYESTEKLVISFNKSIDCRGWQACSRMLKKTPCLQHLDLQDMTVSEQMLLVLGRALRLGSHLISLKLQGCGLTGRAVVVLVAAIKLNTTLRELYLNENKMSSSDGIQLGNLMRANTWINLLDVSSNHLQDSGIIQIADGLTEQPDGPGEGLKRLILWNNHLSQNGIAHIGKTLPFFRHLECLDLGSNHVGDDGIHHLKSGLMASHSLSKLYLKNARITCEGVVALAEYIADSHSISHLDLRENSVRSAGLLALTQSVKHNLTLRQLDLDSISIKDCNSADEFEEHRKLLNEISEYCQRNMSNPTQQTEQLQHSASLDRPSGTVNNNNIHQAMKNRSASIPVSRFKVCKVQEEIQAEPAILSSSAPAEMNANYLQRSLESLRTSLAAINGVVEAQPAPGCVSQEMTTHGPEKPAEDTLKPLISAPGSQKGPEKKKLTFVLPEGQPSSPSGSRKNRRMSTPAMPIAASSFRKPHHLKLCKQLESLDLRSSVPFSPTRLFEGWVFPDPTLDVKFPWENQEEN